MRSMSWGLCFFLASAALATWILIAYPLWVRLRAASPQPIEKKPLTPSVSVILPVHNGERYLSAKLQSLDALDYPPDLLEIIVVSNASTDRSEQIAAAHPRVRLLRSQVRGKCAALNTGIAAATGEILFLTDVRQELEPPSLRHLVANFADPRVAAVSGHLKIRAGSGGSEEDVGLYRRFETWLRDSLSSIDSIFGATGAIYALRRRLAVPLPHDLLLDDMYLPLAAFRQGYRLVVDPAAVAWDEPTDRRAEFGRKVRTLAGNYQLLWHYPWLLGPSNRLAFDYWSYKVGRLLLPELFAVLLISAFFLPSPLRSPILAAFAAFALLILCDPWLRGPLKKISSPLRTLAVMLWATVLGLQVLFRPAQSLWTVTGATPTPPSNPQSGS